MNNFTQRTLTAVIFAATLIGAIYWNKFSFLALFLTLSVVGVLEFFTLFKKKNLHPNKWIGAFGAISIFLAAYLYNEDGNLKWYFITIIPAMAAMLVALFGKSKNPFEEIAVTFLGWMYVAVPFTLSMVLAFWGSNAPYPDYHGEIILAFIFLIWSSDTGAYLVGSAIGKTKLFERVSPKKSWEGLAGGVALTILVAWLEYTYTDFIPSTISQTQWLVVGAIACIFGTLGDLVESLFKRNIGVKDSGKILPGHGGILDRFDAYIFALPLVCVWLYLS